MAFNSLAGLVLLTTSGLISCSLILPAEAEVKSATGWSTLVNSSTDGCFSGVCKISGGVTSGSNLFHKLEKLNTVDSGGITKIEIDNNESTAIIISNIDSYGSKISKPLVALGSKADVTLLSPGGIQIYDGFSVSNVQNITLTTADKISIGGGVFDSDTTTLGDASALNGTVDYTNLQSSSASNKYIDFKVSDDLTIDSNLLMISEYVDIDPNNNPTIVVNGSLEVHGPVEIKDTTLNVESLNIKGEGNAFQTTAIELKDLILNSTGDILLDGTGASESSSDKFSDNGGVLIKRSNIESSSGSITLNGVGGNGNGTNDIYNPIGCPECGESDGPEADYIDTVGKGVDIRYAQITAGTSAINITGAAGSGGVIKSGQGIEINGDDEKGEISKLRAQNISLDGTGAASNEILKAAEGIRIQNSSEIHATDSLTLKGRSANTSTNSTTLVYRAHGILVGTSHLKSNTGMISLEGRGASGNQVKRAYGLYIQNEASIRGARIKLTGYGGNAFDLGSSDNANSYGNYGNSYNNSGIKIERGPTFDTNSANDSGSLITLGDSDKNNGLIEMIGFGGNGVEEVKGVGFSSGSIIFDSGGDISITGTGGTGDYVEDSQGLDIEGNLTAFGKIKLMGTGGSAKRVEDGIGTYVEKSTITAHDLEIDGFGGAGREFTTSTPGSMIYDSTVNLTGSLDIYGRGGVASLSKDTSKSSQNGGVVISESTFNMPNSNSLKIDGVAGDGGNFGVGTWIESSNWTVGGNSSISGKGGDGNDLTLSIGVALDTNVLSVDGDLTFVGIGGQGVQTTSNYGVGILASQLSANSFSFNGIGGSSSNTDESKENYGVGFVFSNFLAKTGNFVANGTGGSGGEDNTGVGILASNIMAANGIVDIDGKGGSGKVVLENNGVGIWSAQSSILNTMSDYTDSSSNLLQLFDSYSYTDTSGNSTTWYGNKIEAASIDIHGVGGIPTDKNQSLKNFGISMDDTKLTSSGTMNLTGQGGDGGQSIAGINIKDVTVKAGGDTVFTGIAGVGDRVTKGEGIIFDSSTLEVTSANQIKLIGTGSGVDTETQVKTVNRLEKGEGINIKDSTITSLTSSPTIEITGTGGQSDDKINSQDNSGIKISNSTINSENGGGNQIYTGIGGIGGKLNTGIVLESSTIKSKAGTLSFSGTGGGGINIKESLGIASKTIELSGSKISLDGVGGDSTLKKNALDANNIDTFNQTADNIGIEVKDSQISSLSGDLSITGNGGQLSVDGITNPDKDDDIEAISVASSLEGVTLSNVTTTATASTLISGQAGKPIAGDKNRGTTIINSTIQTATAPVEVVDSATERNVSAKSVDNRIEGNAYSGTNDNYGLSIDSTDIESTNQDLILAGRGGLKATGEKNYGIYIGNQSSVKVGKDGNSKLLNIYGAGGDGTDMTGGVLTENTNYTVVGTLNMYGESQGAGGFGNNSVEIFNGVKASSSNDTNISGNNNVNISDADISSGNDTNITAENDINLNDTTIDSGNDSNLTSGDDVNVSGSSINSKNNTNVNAGNDINVSGSSVSSGNDINLNALGSIGIADSSLTSGNSINLQATNITTSGVELSSQQVSIQSTSFSSDNPNQSDGNFYNNSISLSQGAGQDGEVGSYTDNQLTMSLSGNVNYFSDQSEGTNQQSVSDSKDSGKDIGEKDRSPQQSAQSGGAATVLSSKQIQQRHMQSEEQTSNYVAEQLGLKRQPALTIQAIQQILTNGRRMMNSSIR